MIKHDPYQRKVTIARLIDDGAMVFIGGVWWCASCKAGGWWWRDVDGVTITPPIVHRPDCWRAR